MTMALVLMAMIGPIVATVIMPTEYEQTLWPLMLEACKTPWFR